MTDNTISICTAFPVTAKFYRDTDDRVEREYSHKAIDRNRFSTLSKAAAVARAKDEGINVNSQTSKHEAVEALVQRFWERSDLAALYKREEEACNEELQLLLITIDVVRSQARRYRKELEGLVRRGAESLSYLSHGRVEWSGVTSNYALPADEYRVSLETVLQNFVPVAARGSEAVRKYILGLLRDEIYNVYGVRSFISELLVPELDAIKAGTSDAVDDEIDESSALAEFSV